MGWPSLSKVDSDAARLRYEPDVDAHDDDMSACVGWYERAVAAPGRSSSMLCSSVVVDEVRVTGRCGASLLNRNKPPYQIR
jgi:hypothetical protein